MNKDYYRQKIREYLFSRDVKKPGIRMNALERVFNYMKAAGGFFNKEQITLQFERGKTIEVLTKAKGNELSSSDKHVIKLMYDYYIAPEYSIDNTESEKEEIIHNDFTVSDSSTLDFKEIEKKLINGIFITVNELENGTKIPDQPGIYCIKIRKGVYFPKDYGKIREDGIIYIGKAEKSLHKRLWDQELNHNGHATFFRSIGAMLGKRPPKGSLYGSDSRNYEFNFMDTEYIRKWMRQSLFVNFITLPKDRIKLNESKLIEKYCPLVNIKKNPKKSESIIAARKECVDIAQSKP